MEAVETGNRSDIAGADAPDHGGMQGTAPAGFLPVAAEAGGKGQAIAGKKDTEKPWKIRVRTTGSWAKCPF